MNTFEQELVKAMRYGCPYCGRYMFNIGQNIAVSKSYPDGELGIHHGRYTEVWCGEPQCDKLLWEAEEGWVTELHKVIREGQND